MLFKCILIDKNKQHKYRANKVLFRQFQALQT